MGETLGMIHIGAKVLYISGSVKLENKVSIPKIQQWERHSTSVTDIPITKKGKGKMKEEKGHQSQLISKASRTNSIRFQDLGLVLCGWRVLLLHLWFCLLCPRICPHHDPSFSWKLVCVCSWMVLSACFLLVEFGESDSFPSFCPISVSFSPSRQCFCWYNVLKNFVGLLCISQAFMSVDKMVLPISLIISISCFCWDGWGNPSVTHTSISCSATPLAFSLEHTFWIMNLLI